MEEITNSLASVSLSTSGASAVPASTASAFETLYSYTPLAPGHLRLLTISRATSPDKKPQFHIQSYSLENCPSYLAISHRWDLRPSNKAIQLDDGRSISVSENIWSLLHNSALGVLGSSELVWIDSICIDQSSVTERNHQVALMGRIYRQARGVEVWLGPEEDAGRDALIWLQDLEKTERQGLPVILDAQYGPHVQLALWTVISHVLQKDYWQRVWVIQEIILARHVRLLYGDKSVSWRAVKLLMRFADHSLELRKARSGPRVLTDQVCRIMESLADGHIATICSHRNTPGGYFSATTSSSARSEWDERDIKVFKRLIQKYKDFQCSEAHDYVYGLLGMMDDDGYAEHITVDYKKSLRDLCLDVFEMDREWLFYRFLSRRLGLGRWIEADQLPALGSRKPLFRSSGISYAGTIQDLKREYPPNSYRESWAWRHAWDDKSFRAGQAAEEMRQILARPRWFTNRFWISRGFRFAQECSEAGAGNWSLTWDYDKSPDSCVEAEKAATAVLQDTTPVPADIWISSIGRTHRAVYSAILAEEAARKGDHIFIIHGGHEQHCFAQLALVTRITDGKHDLVGICKVYTKPEESELLQRGCLSLQENCIVPVQFQYDSIVALSLFLI